jgi:hypothetical protein
VPKKAGVEVEGLDDFRRDLDRTQKQMTPGLTKAHKTLAKEVAAQGRQFARGHGGSTGHFAGSIYGVGSAKRAALTNRKDANAAIWGAKKNTGWNVRAKRGGARQHPKWVGEGWEVGGPGGPRGINDAVRHDKTKIDNRFLELVVDEPAKPSFPGGT